MNDALKGDLNILRYPLTYKVYSLDKKRHTFVKNKIYLIGHHTSIRPTFFMRLRPFLTLRKPLLAVFRCRGNTWKLLFKFRIIFCVSSASPCLDGRPPPPPLFSYYPDIPRTSKSEYNYRLSLVFILLPDCYLVGLSSVYECQSLLFTSTKRISVVEVYSVWLSEDKYVEVEKLDMPHGFLLYNL